MSMRSFRSGICLSTRSVDGLSLNESLTIPGDRVPHHLERSSVRLQYGRAITIAASGQSDGVLDLNA